MCFFSFPSFKITSKTNVLPIVENSGVSEREYGNIVESINISTENKGRKTYKKEDKMKIAKCVNIYGVATAVRRYKSDFPKITESTVHGWLMKFRKEMKSKVSLEEIVLSNKRGRPLLLLEELDAKLRVFINNQRKPGGTTNCHMVCVILMGQVWELTRICCNRWLARLSL